MHHADPRCNQGIERSTLGGADLAQIQLFNEVFIPECNTESLRMVFHDLSGAVYTCSPTVCGTMRLIADGDATRCAS